MTIKDALLTIPEYAPDRLPECTDLIRHIEHGDAALYTGKAIARIAEYLKAYAGVIPDSVRHDITRALLSAPGTNAFATVRMLSGLTQDGMARMFGIPKRTIESWDEGIRSCSDYVLRLILYRLCNENYIDLPVVPAE